MEAGMRSVLVITPKEEIPKMFRVSLTKFLDYVSKIRPIGREIRVKILIPNRSAMDFDFAHYMLMGGKVGKDISEASSPSKLAYRKQLAEIFNMNRTRILAFKNKPPTPAGGIFKEPSFVHQAKPSKPQRSIPQSSERILDAPELLDDYYLNLLDWGSSNVLAIALQNTVYLYDASDGSTSELVTIDDEDGPVTSVSWAPNGQHIAVGLNNSDVQLWDTLANKQLRTLRGGHRSRVGALDWNNHILTSGGQDSLILNNDVRIRSHIVESYTGHHREVCGLKWSASGRQLASGGNDNLLFIWDKSMASLNSPMQWLHSLEDHTAAVKALAWCPYQSNLLASGGGLGDQCIKFWNTHTGACLNSVNTGSQVCSLLWNKNERELLSSHGDTDNQLTVWKYPSMVKIAELFGHTSRVLSDHENTGFHYPPAMGADSNIDDDEEATLLSAADTCALVFPAATSNQDVMEGTAYCPVLLSGLAEVAGLSEVIVVVTEFSFAWILSWAPQVLVISEDDVAVVVLVAVEESPDGCTVASAAADETLRFWNVFGTPEVAKPAPKTNWEPFANIARIR
ncbi:hypothetical protein HHK36_028286 [Tetracentron sinense]|uniref:CDC20/Fizzy WD40 domain-containing protein n=1 Tax=Tetracentron sinense TaxID=13715 RepID=A0A834YIX2_TETSI|nr:hypothetical protein HHK36_028286 [Tetracentron sinense]